MLGWTEIETRAVKFQKDWKNCQGDERQDAQTFEKDFMNIFGVDFRDGLHEYQIRLKDGRIGYVDYLIPGKILIEMKSKGKSLASAYTQAMSYVHALKVEEIPKLVMLCDFDKIEIYNLDKDHRYKPFKVSQLKNHVRIFANIAGYNSSDEIKTEIELNVEASYKMAKLHDLLKLNGYTGQNLELYLVRILFCLFADDTGIFEKESFEDYIKQSKEDGSDLSMRIMMLFSILDTSDQLRMKNLTHEMNKFRYINGNLFTEKLPPAFFDSKMRQIILDCCKFDWSQISPAIFGAMFQGIMDQAQRRELGAHYTSEENIIKVIAPLFLDDLYNEFERSKRTIKELSDFHNKIANLKFFDPACGSGNFLIITYQKIRELEFEILKHLYHNGKNQQMAVINAVYTKVNINQFYGIEYEDFACEIARLSMLLMKHLMDQEISNYFGINIIDFPIKENANIVNGNALEINWENVTKCKVDYIIGNPPFVGSRYMKKEQSNDLKTVFGDSKIGSLDYVSGWYYKAAQYMKFTKTRTAFVSTNSITQGEQVTTLWKPILNDFNMSIDFAYQTFKWSNEAKGKAAVHCVIVSFSDKRYGYTGEKIIYKKDNTVIYSKNINGYLLDAPTIFIKPRSQPISNIPKIRTGTRIGAKEYTFTEDEMLEFVKQEPLATKYFYEYLGGKEFLNNQKRFCLYLEDCPISDLSKMPKSKNLIDKVKESRINENHQLKEYPRKYVKLSIPKNEYIFIPQLSSENRRYIPMGFISKDIWAADPHFMIEGANLFIFGVLTSNVHMAWMRTVAGRLKSDYRYSNKLVYNTFPFPDANDEQKKKIIETASAIINLRNKDDSLANIYNQSYMPTDLKKAHHENDKAVWESYGKSWDITSEEDCIAYLMKLYQKLENN